MVKVQNNIATSEPIPPFLIGLAAESLADLSWTDPALGVSDCAWWPEVDHSPVLGEYERYGTPQFAIDAANKRVIVTRSVEPWSADEIAADKKAKVPKTITPRQIRQALTRLNLRSAVEAAVAAGDQDLKDWWEFSSTYERNHMQVIAMGAALNKSAEELDALWTLASTL